MGTKIQIRRGLKADLPTLDVGEQGYCTDTNEMYIGTPTGNQKMTFDQTKYDSYDAQLADNETVIIEGGLDRVKASSKFITNALSWIGLLNTKFTDNATRFYLLAKTKVTTGVGGCLKIFGDNYQDGADYRDLGIYFHADQNGDKGYFNNGVFWINGKVFPGGEYDGKNPDIGFSFQDGETIAGRLVRLGSQKAIWVFGVDKPTLHGINPNVWVEFQKEAGFKNNVSLKFRNSTNDKDSAIRMNTDDFMFHSTLKGLKVFTEGGIERFRVTESSVETKSQFVQNYLSITNNSATPSVKDGNVYVVANTSATSITNFLDGISGQQITLIINDSFTTIVNGTSIKLKGGVNYRPTNLLSNITLMRLGSSWVEVSRTEL